MLGARAVLADHGSMAECSIPFVLFETVDRKSTSIVAHEAVPIDLCEDRCGGNAHAETIARHDRRMWQTMRTESIPVHEKVGGLNGESVDGTMHGIERGLKDVHIFDALHADNADVPGQCMTFDLGDEEFTRLGGEYFRVGQSARDRCRIEDDGGRNNRSGQRTTSGLVDAGNDMP